jgi:carbonic anhydrase
VRSVYAAPSPSPAGRYVRWLTIADPRRAVLEDVQRIREHPLVARDIPIYGYIHVVKSGKLVEVTEVTEATEAGRVAAH